MRFPHPLPVRRVVRRGLVLLTLPLAAACNSDGPTMPDTPSLALATHSVDFGGLDVDFGTGMPMTVTVTNGGSSSFTVGPVTVTGSAASDFVLTDASDVFTVAPGGSVDIHVAFDPTAEGARSAALSLPSDDMAAGTLEASLSGTGAHYTYQQVDRLGIPALNTVFNHPPQFDKKAYNVAGPGDDLRNYRARFETVLGAVANADPSATATLLLPDELPVSLAAATTHFAELNGRALDDDAVDVALTVVVGIETLHSDNVDANDVAFLPTFPFLADPH